MATTELAKIGTAQSGERLAVGGRMLSNPGGIHLAIAPHASALRPVSQNRCMSL